MNLPHDNTRFASLNRFFARFSGTRFLTFSILFHIILLALCGGAYIAGQSRPPDFPIPGMDRFEMEDPDQVSSLQVVCSGFPANYNPPGPTLGGQVYESILSVTRVVPEFAPAVNIDSRPGAGAESKAFAKLLALAPETPN